MEKEVSFDEKKVSIRLSDRDFELIDFLMKRYPDAYPSMSLVFRAGLRALVRWKFNHVPVKITHSEKEKLDGVINMKIEKH